MSSTFAAPGMPTRRSPRLAARAANAARAAAVEPRRSPRIAALAAAKQQAEIDYSEEDNTSEYSGCTGLCDIYVREALDKIRKAHSDLGYITTYMVADLLKVIDEHENFFDIVDFPIDPTGYDSYEIQEAIAALTKSLKHINTMQDFDKVAGPLSYGEIYANKSSINERIRDYIIDFFNIPEQTAPRRSPRLAARRQAAAKKATVVTSEQVPIPTPFQLSMKETGAFIANFKAERAAAKAALDQIETKARIAMDMKIANQRADLAVAMKTGKPTGDLTKQVLHTLLAAVECNDVPSKVLLSIDIYNHVLTHMTDVLAKYPRFMKTVVDKVLELKAEIEIKVKEGKISAELQEKYNEVAGVMVSYVATVLPSHPLYVKDEPCSCSCECDTDAKSDNPDRG